ncbi:dynamin family protein [Catenuloplanes sp. NPDC051500]|uniref:dynamin family protein n=1 Tax=Catenuloplanes sp. NPDC051500 TaxID=3363959 RepID=UPI00378C4F25
MSDPTTAGYEWVGQIRAELLRLVLIMNEVADQLALPQLADIAELRERVGSDEFVVLVAGEFKTGKSTTINAVLGAKVLPARATPATAVLSVVRYADAPAARLYALDESTPSGVSDTPTPISIEDLNRYVTIDELHPDDVSTWGLAEIDWPLELCRNGVVVVDSPGLNEHPARSKVTMGYVGRADAIVFVSDATRALSASERDFLNLHIKAQGHDDIFFICNRINLVDDDPDEQDAVRNRVLRILAENWDASSRRVFFVDARSALRGRQGGDPAQVAASGIPDFERELEFFLTHQRATLKIVPPARHLNHLVAKARDAIDRQIRMLDENVETLRDRYDRAQEPMRHLEQERRLIVTMIEQQLSAARADAEDSARRMLADAAASCATWAREAEREHRITMNPFTARKQVEAATQEVAERLGVRLQAHFATWQAETLMPMLEAHLERLEGDIDDNLRHFVAGIDEVTLSFTAGSTASGAEVAQPSALERTAATAVGLVLSPGMALVGARFGFKQVLAGVGPQLGVAVLGVLLGFGPFGLAAMLAAAAFIQFVVGLDRANEHLANKVAEKVADEIRGSAPEQAAKIGGEVQAALDTIRMGIDSSLGGQLAGVRKEVETVMYELSQGRDNAARVKRELLGHRARLDEVDSGAVDIITQFTAMPS